MTNQHDPTDVLFDVLDRIGRLTPDAVEDGNLVDLARRVQLLAGLAMTVKTLSESATMTLAERMETDRMTIAGVGVVERSERRSKQWIDSDSRDRLFHDVVRSISAKVARDPMSGEILPPLRAVATETFDLIEQTFSLTPKAPRTVRRTVGIDLDEYQSNRVSGYRVDVVDLDERDGAA